MLGKNGTYIIDSFWDLIWSRSYVNYEKHHQTFWKLTRDNAIGSVLDLGCGSGSCWSSMSKDLSREIVGVDFSSVACAEFVKNVPGSTAYTSKIEDLDIDGRFDTVVLSGVVNYYRDLEPIRKQLKRYAMKRIIVTINVIKDFEDREWNPDLINREFGELGGLNARFYDKIGWFIIINVC